ncbi:MULTISPECIES: hypothetical protein [Acidithrix]|uniref:Bacterial membrane protein YfhO n=1 Tax=Acidithrix ferrooxidans TaxID=1280514 RepID=A0A0D8HH21_9ACTN|nr:MULTISPECIES: hypothetical protein [Acidithrix]KJF17223.1 hypothetical protein AXFE_19360 [Acidithrix ferrooxidans]CAG4914093.1 unnamed protein product [Acidithrix sp. C25]
MRYLRVRQDQYRVLSFGLILLGLYLAINGLPALLGHPVIVSDNLTQNNPLRFLAGEIYRSGHLPTWNIFAWSGTPLLAGFNAGVFFPLEVLYLVLAPVPAFIIFISILECTFAIGMLRLFERLHFNPQASRIVAFFAPILSYFASQSVHLDMLGGLAMLPFMVSAILRLSEEPSAKNSLRQGVIFGTSYALVVLSGAPEAMLYEGIFVALVLLMVAISFKIRVKRLVTFLAIAALVAILLSSAQLIPGYSFITASQRGSHPFNYAAAGPFYPISFISLIAPFLFGGPGSVLPNYFGPYVFEEITIYIGIIFLALAIWTLLRIIIPTGSISPAIDLGSEEQQTRRYLRILTIAAVISTLLALAAFTPLESLMLYVPIYNRQRLPSRNIFALDFLLSIYSVPALSNLFARRRIDKTLFWIVGGLVVAIAMANGLLLAFTKTFVAAVDGGGRTHYPLKAILLSSLFEILLLVGFIGIFATKRPRLKKVIQRRLLVGLFILDSAGFAFQSYLGEHTPTSTIMATNSYAKTFANIVKKSYGRYGLYDPNLYYYGDLLKIGTPNLNVYNSISSIQGYSSLSLGNYEAVTSSHQQASFDPTLLVSPLGKAIALSIVATGSLYLNNFNTGSPNPVTIPNASQMTPGLTNSPLTTVHESNFVGQTIKTNRILIDFAVFNPATGSLENSTTLYDRSIKSIGVSLNGSKKIHYGRLTSQSAIGTTGIIQYTYTLNQPTTFNQVLATQTIPKSGNLGQSIEAGISFPVANGYITLNSPLTQYLTPQHYHLVTTLGSLEIYQRNTAPLVTMPAVANPSNPSEFAAPPIVNASNMPRLIASSIKLDGSMTYKFSASKPTVVTISQTWAKGWMIANQAASGSSGSQAMPAQECGVFICFSIPAGVSNIHASYKQPHLSLALATSGLGLILIVVLLLLSKDSDSGESKRTKNKSIKRQK